MANPSLTVKRVQLSLAMVYQPAMFELTETPRNDHIATKTQPRLWFVATAAVTGRIDRCSQECGLAPGWLALVNPVVWGMVSQA